MKTTILPLCALMLLVMPCRSAELRLPHDSYTLDQLDAARAVALESKKPICFLLANKNTTCPPCMRASLLAIDELSPLTVLVYVSGEQLKQLPENLRDALGKQGHLIPKLVVTDHSTARVLGGVSYQAMKTESSAAFGEIKKAIAGYPPANE